jgi:hypothetical protein
LAADAGPRRSGRRRGGNDFETAKLWLDVRACLQPDRSRNDFAFQSRCVLVSL